MPASVRTVPGHKLPPHYPNGWIPILESCELGANQLKSVVIFGRELVVARGGVSSSSPPPGGRSQSSIYIFDAYCPHLGANLSVGGTIHRESGSSEDCVRCPFHGWSFRMSDGACSHIPYEESPTGARLKVWQALELNNVIFVWHHSDDQPPNWFPTQSPELSSGKWIYRSMTRHTVNCHIQDIPENGPDVAHLNEIHADSFALGGDISWSRRFKELASSFGHYWTATWTQRSAPESHIADVSLFNTSKIFGFEILTVHLAVNQIGPAYVELRFKSDFLGGISGMFVQQVQPIGPMRNCIIHHIYTENTVLGYIFGKFLMLSEARLLERDIQIWNRKAYLSKPHFAKSEKSLVKYRRWYSQFYPKNKVEW